MISLLNNDVANLDLTPLAQVPNLATLYVRINSYPNTGALLPLDLSPIAGLSKLQRLFVGGYNIKDLSVVNTFPLLQEFNGGTTGQNNSLSLNNMPELTSLDLTTFGAAVNEPATNTNLTTISLANMPKLKVLVASNSKLATLTLSNTPQLTDLNVARDNLTSLSLSNVPALVELGASYNQLSTISLSNMPNLKTLFLDHNKLTSLMPLMPLFKSLPPTSYDEYFINLDFNEIADISPFLGYVNALTCGIRPNYNPIPQAQWTKYNKQCENLY